MNRIFVYGSLKPGGWAHDRFMGDARNPLPAKTRGVLYSVSNFPTLKRTSSDIWVRGLVYEVDESKWEDFIANLDRLEGYPRLFDREILPIVVEGSEDVFMTALVYFGKDPHLFKGDIIQSGVWEV